MVQFERFTPETAPEKSKDALQETVNSFGTTLNIFGDMAQSPLPIELYRYGQTLLMERGTLSNEEVNLLHLAISVSNGCEFCVPAHSHIARQQYGTDDAVVDAIREGRDVPDAKLNALTTIAQRMVQARGEMAEEEIQMFLDAGYTKEQIFEVLCVVAYKTITNYTSKIAGTTLNEFLEPEAWDEPQALRQVS